MSTIVSLAIPDHLASPKFMPRPHAAVQLASKLHAVGALEAQYLAGLLGGGDLIAELLHQAAHLANLLGIALGQLPPPDIEAVLQPHAHIASHHHRLGCKRD